MRKSHQTLYFTATPLPYSQNQHQAHCQYCVFCKFYSFDFWLFFAHRLRCIVVQNSVETWQRKGKSLGTRLVTTYLIGFNTVHYSYRNETRFYLLVFILPLSFKEVYSLGAPQIQILQFYRFKLLYATKRTNLHSYLNLYVLEQLDYLTGRQQERPIISKRILPYNNAKPLLF